MHHGNADRGRDEKGDALSYTIGHGIDAAVGGSGRDRAIICGRAGCATAFLVEDGATYSARVGSNAGADQILVSADGALFMSLSNIEEVTIRAADPRDRLTVAGDFSGTMLDAGGLRFEGPGDRVDASAVRSGHRVTYPAAAGKTDRKADSRRRGGGEGDDGATLLIFRTGGGADDEPCAAGSDRSEW